MRINPKIRTLVLVVVALLMLEVRPVSASISASQAFQQLTTTYAGPGGYSTGTRNIMVAGSMRVWTPSTSVQLISLQPPSINAGCGGISLYFGGFSFINGAEFQQLVTDVMQNAEGYVMELAIRTLCPMCADILDSMQKLAQMANSLGANSCAIATDLVNKAAKYVGVGPNALSGGSQATASQHACSKEAQNTGVVGDYDQALSSICSTVQAATSSVDQYIAGLSSAAQNQAESNLAAIHGNTEWVLLTQQGYADTDIKDLVLSLTGFSVKPSEGNAQSVPYPSTLTPHAYIQALLYGVDPLATAKLLATQGPGGLSESAYSNLAADYDKEAQAGHYENSKVYLCGTTINGQSTPAPGWTPYGSTGWADACDGPFPPTTGSPPGVAQITSLYGNSQFDLLGQNGLLYDVGTDLGAAITAVQNNKAIPPQALALMQLTPLPVYQMVNIAAVYPGVASRLVSSYTQLIALQIAQSVTERGLSDMSSTVIGAPGSPGPGAFQAIQNTMRKLQHQIHADTRVMDREVYMEEGMFTNIQQIQRVIADQATQNGLAGGMLFTRGLAASVAEGH